ncbi:MAG: hypothetical protein Q8O13_03525 [Candidatus Omnitrophota bacterium]|nr:hypothetical protein [Candidatus Omnitrophota bacterium]
MFIQLGNVENLVVVPFIIVFFLCWFAFCIILISKPQSWLDFQNRFTRQYGLEWKVTDEKKFSTVNKKAGWWLIVLGACAAFIIFGFIAGFIPIFV